MTVPNPDATVPDGERDSRQGLQDKAIRGAMWTLIHTVVALPLAFIVNLVVARTLGAVDYGRLAYLTTVMAIAAGAIELGVGTGVIQFGARAHAAGRRAEVERLLRASQGFRLMVGVPVMSTVVLLLADADPLFLGIAIIFGIALPAVFAGVAACISIENKTAQGAKNAMVANLVVQLAVVTTAITVSTAESIWITRMAFSGLAAVLATFFVLRAYRRASFRPTGFLRLGRAFWAFAIPVGLAGLVSTLVLSRSEVVVLTWLGQQENSGLFALAFGLATQLFSPAQALLGPLIPAIAGLKSIDEASVVRALQRTLRASATASGTLIACVVAPLALLVPTLYGSSFASAAGPMLALGCVGGVLVLSGPLQAFVQARLSGRRLLQVNLVALTVNVVLVVVLAPTIGLWGAVIANAAGAIVQVASLLLGEARELALPLSRALRSISPLLSGAAAASLAFAGGGLVTSAIPGAVVAALIGSLAYVGALRLTRTGMAPVDLDAVITTLPTNLKRIGRPALAMVSFARPADADHRTEGGQG